MGGLTKGAGLALPMIFFTRLAQAHTDVGSTGSLTTGLTHPLLGLDHILAMVAVGLWAALVGGRAMWLVPCAFVVAMAMGGMLAMEAFALPAVELVIVGSVVILGVLIAAKLSVPVVAAMGIAALFAVFHGHAHGGEITLSAVGLLYSLGFVISTAFLHAVGIGLALLSRKLATEQAVRASGGAIAIAGVALFLIG